MRGPVGAGRPRSCPRYWTLLSGTQQASLRQIRPRRPVGGRRQQGRVAQEAPARSLPWQHLPHYGRGACRRRRRAVDGHAGARGPTRRRRAVGRVALPVRPAARGEDRGRAAGGRRRGGRQLPARPARLRLPLPAGGMRPHSRLVPRAWLGRGSGELRGPHRLHGQLAGAGPRVPERGAAHAAGRGRALSARQEGAAQGDPPRLPLPPARRLLPAVARHRLQAGRSLTELVPEVVVPVGGGRGGDSSAQVSSLHGVQLALQRVLGAPLTLPHTTALPRHGGLSQRSRCHGRCPGVTRSNLRVYTFLKREQRSRQLPVVQDPKSTINHREEVGARLHVAVAAAVGAVLGLGGGGADGRADPGDSAEAGAAAARAPGDQHREPVRGDPGPAAGPLSDHRMRAATAGPQVRLNPAS